MGSTEFDCESEIKISHYFYVELFENNITYIYVNLDEISFVCDYEHNRLKIWPENYKGGNFEKLIIINTIFIPNFNDINSIIEKLKTYILLS